MYDEVEEYNSRHPFNPIQDPSSQLIDMVLLLLTWYHLYRRQIPAKDEDDIKTLRKLADE
jgi:hypothetical protein